MKVRFFIVLLSLILIPFFSSGQVVINEISAANYSGGGSIDNYSEYEDWVELYNPTGNAVSLNGYFLSDNETNLTKWAFPDGVSVPAYGHLVIYASARDEYVDGFLHTSYKITQGKQEGAVLSDANGNIVDSFLILAPNQRNHSRGRVSDGAATWGLFTTPTPGAANVNPVNEYPMMEINTPAGGYSGSVTVTMTPLSPNSKIHYTTDGFEPTEASPQYTAPVVITNTTVIRARAFSNIPNTPPGFIETNTYFIDESHDIPIVSVSGDGILTLLNGTQIEPMGHFEFFDKDGVFLAESGGEYNKHGNDSWAYAQRGLDYITRDQFGYGNEIEHPIFRNKNRNEFQRVILKAGANDNYPFEDGGAHIRDPFVQSLSQMAGLRLDERTYEPCVLYANGQYWGVYELREKVDDLDFTDHYANQGRGEVDFLKTWGNTWAEYGSAADWNTLRDFILTNDMTDPGNYEYVTGLYNTRSLIDYFTLNSYVVCADWLNWNTGWWRGRNPNGSKKKWRYILWDMDATFGHYTNYTGIPDQSAGADPCEPEAFGDLGGQGHVPIWNKLLTNETFFAEYINRYAELSGSYFSCEYMHAHLDSLVGNIASEMPRHIQRWGGNIAEWEGNVQLIHDFIDERCAVITDGFLDCYPELDGPYQVTLLTEPIGAGTIETASMDISDFPFTANYFGGINAVFQANENTGYTFSHWTSNGTVILPDPNTEAISVSFTANDTLIAHFIPDEVYTLTLDVYPPNTGNITIDGTVYNSFPVQIEISGGALHETSAQAIEGWGFVNWTSTFALDVPVNTNPAEFSLASNGSLTANFFEVIYDVTFDVSPPGAGSIEVNGDLLENLAQTVVLQGNVPIDIRTKPIGDFYQFSHWNTLVADPLPNGDLPDVTMNFQGPDVVVANYVELLNYPLMLDVEPRGAGWIQLPDTVVREFPYQRNMMADTPYIIEASARGKYAFDHWEVIYGMPINNTGAAYQKYKLRSPTKLVAHFKERFHAVFIPTSFSPNGDGVNDIFKVYAREIDLEDFRLSIMSRWGQEMFYTEDITKGWDGSHNTDGYYAPPGIYAYFVRYVDTVTKQITEKAGTVVLVR